MVRVLNVFVVLNRGGAESRTMDIYRKIDRMNVQFDFMVHTDEIGVFEDEIERLGGIVYHQAPRYRVMNFLSYYRFWIHFFREHSEYNIIHIHTTNFAVPILMAAKKCCFIKRICHSRNASVNGCLKKLLVNMHRTYLRKNSTLCLAVSNEAGKFVFGRDYQIVPNAIQAELFRYNKKIREEYRRDWNLENNYVICNVARFYPQKNHFFIIDIFSIIKKKILNAKLLLVGDGGLKVKVQNYAQEKGVEKDVLFVGVREDVANLLQMSDIFILPSSFEGLPGTALEAQAAGLPVLLSDIITQEAKIIDDLVCYLPIDRGSQIWADEILLKYKKNMVRRDTYKEIRDAGYDIDTVVNFYQDLYCLSEE